MNKNNGILPANPIFNDNGSLMVIANQRTTGLTKRETFAMAAMQGFAANPEQYSSVTVMADDAVRWADTLLKSLDNG